MNLQLARGAAVSRPCRSTGDGCTPQATEVAAGRFLFIKGQEQQNPNWTFHNSIMRDHRPISELSFLVFYLGVPIYIPRVSETASFEVVEKRT